MLLLFSWCTKHENCIPVSSFYLSAFAFSSRKAFKRITKRINFHPYNTTRLLEPYSRQAIVFISKGIDNIVQELSVLALIL